MIAFPMGWDRIGLRPPILDIENRLKEVLKNINCRNLSLSGGIDSSLMLYFMCKVFGARNISCFTIALSEVHPDFYFSKMIIDYFGVDWNCHIPNHPLIKEENDYFGDEIVREFYSFLIQNKICNIIACDGIDEFMGGYYDHLSGNLDVYYDYLSRLQSEHLERLDFISNEILVYLPYMDDKLINMYNNIPISGRFGNGERKKIMFTMAEGKLPSELINRRKYGFCDAMRIKE